MKLEDIFTADELALIDSGKYKPGREVLDAKLDLIAAIEREACLKIAESMSLTDANMNKTWRTGCRDVAEAIQARGET
jgi:hypothetical protein